MTTTPTLWLDIGQVNTSDSGPGGDTQFKPASAALTNGGFVVVWEDRSHTGTDATADSIKFQLYDDFGQPRSTEKTVELAVTGIDEGSPSVAALPDGGFVVAYQSFGANALRFTKYDQNGNEIVSGVVDSVGNDPFVTAFGNGFTVTYDRMVSMEETNVFRKFIEVDGTNITAGPAKGVVNEDDDQQVYDIATLANGSIIIAYSDEYMNSATDLDVFFKIIDTNDNIVATGAGENSVATDDFPAIAGLTGGGIVMVWETSADITLTDASGTAINARVYNNNGAVTTTTFLVNTTTTGDQSDADVTALNDGGFFVSWKDFNTGAIEGQRFDDAGAKVGSQFTIDNNVNPSDVSLATSTGGRIFAAYTELDTADNDIFAQIWDPRDTIINGTSSADRIVGRIDGSTINGLGGDDVLFGMNAADILSGGNGHDIIRGGSGLDMLLGDSGNDKLFGDSGIDNLFGGGGKDVIRGGSANDEITGGKSKDILYGEGGKDEFVYTHKNESGTTASTRDKIKDFSGSNAEDINLKAIDANSKKDGNQKFEFIGQDEFSGNGNAESKDAGQLRYEKKSNKLIVEADINGDGEADMTIEVLGAGSLQAEDFIL